MPLKLHPWVQAEIDHRAAQAPVPAPRPAVVPVVGFAPEASPPSKNWARSVLDAQRSRITLDHARINAETTANRVALDVAIARALHQRGQGRSAVPVVGSPQSDADQVRMVRAQNPPRDFARWHLDE